MDILLDEQEMEIQEAISSLFTGECSTDLLRKSEEHPLHYSPELWNRFTADGWLRLCLSAECGGEELPLSYLALLFELAGYHIAPLPLHSTLTAALIIDRHGNEEQRKLLLDVSSGDLIMSHAVVEQNGRWSTNAITLEGRIDGEELVLNGRKGFVGGFLASSQCVVIYRDASSPENLGVVLVPTDIPGLKSEALISMAKDGEATIHFEDVRVPLRNRIGETGAGNEIAREMMDFSAVLYACMMAGAARRTLDMAVEHAKQREAFGQPIGAFQAIQHLCANMLNAIDGTVMLAREALWRLDRGLAAHMHVAQAKSFANEHCMMTCRSAQQIHGGMGFMLEFDLNLWYRRIGSWSLRGGTIAEHRRTVSAALLDTPGHVRIGAVPGSSI